MNNRLYTIQEVANILGVSTKTLRRWDQRGRLVPTRTAGNQRRYTQEQISKFKTSSSAKASEGQAKLKNTLSEVPPLFSENEAPKEFKATHALPSVLSGLPSGSFLKNHFLLKHKDAVNQMESQESSRDPFSFKRSSPLKLSTVDGASSVNPAKLGFVFGVLVLFLSFAGAVILVKYNIVAGLSEKKEQFAKFIENLPQISLQIKGRDLNQDLSFVPQDLVGSVLAAETGDSGLVLNVNVPAFFSQNVGIGTTTPDASAILDLVSEEKGFLAPRMTEAQIQGIPTPAAGLFVYNNDTNHYNMYNGTAWQGVFTSIGDSTTGEAFTEEGTSGTALYFYDADGRGKLTTANLSGARIYTLPDAEGEVSLLGQSISNSELVNAKVTVSAGTNLTGGGGVSLGSSVTLTLKDSVDLSGTLIVGGATTLNGAMTVAGATLLNGNVTLGDAATDTITFTGRVAQDSDLIPVTATGTSDLGTSALPWDNVYADNVFAASAGTQGYWQRNSSALSPTNITDDVLLGATSTSSAKFAFLNVAGGTPTASVSANSGNNATTLTGLGVLGTTNMQTLTLGNSTTGNIVIDSGSSAITFSDTISPTTSNGAALGTTALMWSDLFLASGSVINLNNGDVTLTHASNALTFAGGNIGLGGQATPLAELDVTGSASLSADLSLRGASTAHTFNILDNGTLNFRRSPGGDDGVANVLYLGSNGNVGIGTTSPAYNLDVVNSAGASQIQISGGGTSSTLLRLNRGDTSDQSSVFFLTNSTTADFVIGVGSYATETRLDIGDATNPFVTITDQGTTGNVGIGNTTPLAALDVTGSASLSANVSLRGSNTAHLFNILQGGTLNFTRSPGGDTVSTTSMFIQGDGNVGIGTTAPGATRLRVVAGSEEVFKADDGASAYIRTTIGTGTVFETGNVGIGNTAPGTTLDVTGTLRASSTVTFTGLTASRAIFTDSSSNLAATGVSANLLDALTDETGTGVAVFGTSPDITTSLTTGSSTFALVNTNATTVNFAQAATTLTMGATTGTATIRNATLDLPNGSATASGNLTLYGAARTIQTTSLNTLTLGGSTTGNIVIDSGSSAITFSDTISPTTSNGAALGTTALMWSDLFLASGSVINLNNGDVTLTHASNVLGIEGGNVGIGTVTPTTFNLEIAGTIGATAGSTYDIGSSARRWATIYGDTGNFTNISGTVTGGSTSSSDWLINSDNATADTENASLTFERGTPATNVQFLWNSTTKQLSTNTPSLAILSDATIAFSGTSALMVNQVQAQDIFTASASGTTRFTIANSGDTTIVGDLAVNGATSADITSTTTTGTIFNTTVTTLSLGGAATTLNLGTTDSVTRTIYLGTGTGADTINIGTGATTANTINIGTGAVANTIAIGSSSTTGLSLTDDNWSIGTGGIITTAGNINANGGLDVDDAFVIADGGKVSTLDISDTDIALTGATTTFTSTGDLTINSGGGDIIFSDADTLNIGGSGSDVAYNIIGDTTTGVDSRIASDDDLFIEGSLHVLGDLIGPATGVSGYWQRASGALAPFNITDDLLLGATSTASAKFAFLNVAGGTPTATISANSGNNATTLTGLGVLGTTNMQTLTLGNSTTGNIVIDSGSSAINFSDTISPTTSDGAALGTTALMWSDLFLASGSVINLNNGDVTLTHASNALTFAGGNVGLGGQATPLAELDVTGSASLSANFNLRGAGTVHTFNILDNGTLNFQRSPGGDAGVTNVLYLGSNGNVGIGNTAPGTTLDVTGTLRASSTVTFTGLTASRAIFTDASSNLAATGVSANLLDALTDETGTGVAVFGTSPAITTSLTTGSTTFALVNTTATTVNFAQGATTLTMGATTGTATIRNATLDLPNGSATASGNLTLYGAARTIQTTALNTLTIGGTTTGNIVIDSGSSAITFSDTITPITSDGAALGTTALMWSDLFLASGSVINLNNGDVTLTHASNALTFAGGNVGLGGQATPLTELDVTGSASLSANLWLRGAGTAHTFNILDNGTLNFQRWPSGDAANNTSVMFLQNNGNVGIGTTSPDANLNIVAGTGAFSTLTMSGGSGSDLRINRSDATAQAWIIRGSSEFSIIDETAAGAPTRITIDTSGNVGIGTTAPISELHVTRPLTFGATGKALAVFDQIESQDILTASASGTTRFTIANSGNTTIVGDLAVNGATSADITSTTTTATLFDTTVTTLSLGGAATTLNLGTTDSVTRTIYLGTGTGADTINIGTGATTANTVNIGTGAVANTIAIGSSSTTTLSLTDDNWSISAAGLITTASDIAVNGDDITSDGNLTISATGYTRIGDTSTPSVATADDDLFIEGDLEIGGGTATMSASTNTLSIGRSGTIQSQDLTTLTIGGTTTGFIVIDSGSGVVNMPDLTASRALFTDASSNLSASGVSSNLLDALTDETGTGVVVFGTSPAITTSLTTGSTTFALVNTTATTVNFAQAATTLTMGATTGTATIRNATLDLPNGSATASGNLTLYGAARTIQTTSLNTLTLGGSTTGNIVVDSGSSAITFSDTISPTTSDGAALGTTALMWSDLFLASGGVVNFNNGDVTLTHASNALTFAGGNVGLGGQTTPLTELDVTGSASLSANLSLRGSNTVHLFNILQGGTLNFTRSPGGDTVSTTSMFIQGDGNVGIGTTAPGRPLDVNGSMRVANGALYEWGSTLGAYIAATVGDNMAFGISSSEKMRILNNGNVGIGTTTPLTLLDVRGAASMSGALTLTTTPTIASTAMLTLTIGGTTTGNIVIDSGSSVITLSDTVSPTTSNGAALGTTALMWSDLFLASGSVINLNNGDVTLTHASNALTFAGGNVGLGGQATPLTELDVTGSASLSANISLRGANTDHMFDILDGGSLDIRRSVGGATAVTALKINSGTDGNVVITTDQQGSTTHRALQVFTGNSAGLAGTIELGVASTGTVDQKGGVVVRRQGDATQYLTMIHGVTSTTVDDVYIGGGSGSATAEKAATNIFFYTAAYGTTTGTERLRIGSTGNVGIGITAPTSQLYVTRPLTFGATGKALAVFDQIESQDILTASASGTTRFVINNAGNVGIGDTTPDSLLDILSATTGTDLIITNTNATDTDVTVGFALAEGTNTFTIGVDDSVTGDPFKISTTALGTSDTFVLDPRTTTSAVSAITLATGTAPTIASAATAYFNSTTFTPGIVNFSGSTQITSTGTSANNAILFNQPTINRTDAATSLTIDQSSNLFINGPTIASHATVGQTETITTASALRIGAGSSVAGTRGVVTNAYGLYVDPPTGATNNYAATFASGNVGIGTTAPVGNFDAIDTGNQIYFERYVAASAQPIINFRKSRSATVGTASTTLTGDYFITMRGMGVDTNNAWREAISIDYIQDAAAGSNFVPGSMAILTTNSAGVNAERVRLTSAGNVGIGTTAPLEILGITGNATISGTLTVDTVRPETGALSLQYKSGGNAWTTGITLLDNSGNVGIGTTSPAADLSLSKGASTANTTLRVENTTNSGASHAIVDIAVGGTTSTGDPQLRWTIPGGTSFYAGVESDSAEVSTNIFHMGTGTAVGTSSIFKMQGDTTVVGTDGNFDVAIGLNAISQTFDSVGGGRDRISVSIGARTVTFSAPGTTVDLNGSLNVGATTFAQTGGAVTISNAFGVNARHPTAGTSVTLTDAAAFRATVGAAGGTLTNTYGLYVEAMTQGTNNYGARISQPGIANGIGATTDLLGLYIPAATTALGNQTATTTNAMGINVGIQTYTSTTLTRTVTNPASIYIQGAPVASTNASFTNGPYALWVDAGVSRFDGNVGIGHTAPTSMLNVTRPLSFGATGKALAVFDQIESQDILTASASGTTKFVVDNAGKAYLGALDLETSNTTATCWFDNTINGVTLKEITDCNGAPTDLAENFGTSDVSIEAGDVVVITGEAQKITVRGTPTSKAFIKKSETAYQSTVVGVVSTAPNQIYGEDGVFEGSENPRPVSLAGRVPVKVNTENGNILVGDPITSSSTPGVGMKATKSGRVIGMALEAYTSADPATVGKIIVFVNPHWMGTSKLLALDGNDRLGIGTTTPSFKLDVQDMQIATAAAQIFNTATGTDADGLVIKLGNTSTTAVAQTNHFINFETSGIGIVGSIQGNGANGVTYATSGVADFAEYFKKDSSQTIEFGKVVCLSDNGLTVPCDSTNGKILGIASERPAFLGGINLGDGSIAVGLVGQVETFVSASNGEIKPGDALAASDIPGVAVKAIKAGQIVGKAVQSFAGAQGEVGKILVSVNVGWYDPTIYIASDGTLGGVPAEVPIDSTIGSALQGDALQDQIASGSAQMNYVLENDPLFKELKDKVSSLQSKFDLLSLQFEQQASISGQVLGVTLDATAVISNVINASASASLVQRLGDVELNNATISDNLMVLGRATVTDLGVTGTINAGMLAIHGLDGEINTLSGDLYLQKDGLGGVNIFNGKIVMDTKGNLTVAGTITAEAVEANNYTVLGQESIGSATIPAGSTSIEVSTAIASSSSKIFLTTTSLTDKQITVVEKKSGKFKVAIPQPTTSPISFDWWIVGNKN